MELLVSRLTYQSSHMNDQNMVSGGIARSEITCFTVTLQLLLILYVAKAQLTNSKEEYKCFHTFSCKM